jgi:hypothetical protein
MIKWIHFSYVIQDNWIIRKFVVWVNNRHKLLISISGDKDLSFIQFLWKVHQCRYSWMYTNCLILKVDMMNRMHLVKRGVREWSLIIGCRLVCIVAFIGFVIACLIMLLMLFWCLYLNLDLELIGGLFCLLESLFW